MSYCRTEGKDKIIFVTPEDHKTPSTTIFSEDIEEEPGLILPNGDINWSCPCLGGMASGPCGVEFRDAFSCFHYSKEEPKGADCFDQFREMQACMTKYPDLYDSDDDKKGEESKEETQDTSDKANNDAMDGAQVEQTNGDR